MFELSRQTGILNNLNLRAEKHGDENVTGADIKVAIKVSNDVLSELHPSLKSAFYRKPLPGEMDLADKGEDDLPLNRLVFGSRIAGVKWDWDIVGAAFTVHFGTGGKSDVELDDVTVDGFALTFMDGGTVAMSFRVKCDPDEKQIAKLAMLIGNEIEFSMQPPADGPVE